MLKRFLKKSCYCIPPKFCFFSLGFRLYAIVAFFSKTPEHGGSGKVSRWPEIKVSVLSGLAGKGGGPSIRVGVSGGL